MVLLNGFVYQSGEAEKKCAANAEGVAAGKEDYVKHRSIFRNGFYYVS